MAISKPERLMRHAATLLLTLTATAAPAAWATEPAADDTEAPPETRPYEGLTPAEALARVTSQPRDDKWADQAEAWLHKRLAPLAHYRADRTLIIHCYSTDCSLEFFTELPFKENADLLFEVVRELEQINAKYSLFSEGPEDRRLLVIVEISGRANRFMTLDRIFRKR